MPGSLESAGTQIVAAGVRARSAREILTKRPNELDDEKHVPSPLTHHLGRVSHHAEKVTATPGILR